MKVSELIQEIVAIAEAKFGLSGHENDMIALEVSSLTGCDWQVSLVRPAQSQLDQGEVKDPSTVKVWTNRYGFFTTGDTLVGALLALRDKIEDAYDCEFTSQA